MPGSSGLCSSRRLSFGACYHEKCECLHYDEKESRTCDCGHSRSFHAPNSLEAWQKLEYPAQRLDTVDASSTLTNLTEALLETNLSGSTTNRNNRNDKSNHKVKGVLQLCYEEGHLRSLQNKSPNLSSLTDTIRFRFFRGEPKHYESISAALDLIDALWSPQVRAHAIHQSFPDQKTAAIAFRDLDRMVLRAAHVLDRSNTKMPNKPFARRDSTLTTLGTILLRNENALSFVQSKIPLWASSNPIAPHQSLRNFIIEEEEASRRRAPDSNTLTWSKLLHRP